MGDNNNTHDVKVCHQWNASNSNGFRQWKPPQLIAPHAQGHDLEALSFELHKRQNRSSEEPDILRWGYSTKGMFTTKEAYSLMHPTPLPRDPLWALIWNKFTWPKISTFLWFLSHKRILTWDNLVKRGFTGPSQCPNCLQNAETIQHLLLLCPLANTFWEKCSFRCQNTKSTGDITNIIRTWPHRPFLSPLLNALWSLLPGIVFWSLWKERNKQIFKNQASSLDPLWISFSINLQESLALRSWNEEDYPTNPKEISISKNWNIRIAFIPTLKIHPNPASPLHWSPPPEGVFKLNFDGASKGNPGPAGFGGIVRNSRGETQLIYYGSIGWDSNNSAEL